MTIASRIRVVVAEDHRMVREALRLVLQAECEVVGEASKGEEAVELAVKLRPQVLILDIAMPGIGGIEAAHKIAQKMPSTKVLILSQYDDEEYVLETLTEAHAAGYLVKTDAAAELLNAVRAVAAGKRYLSPSITPIVLRQLNSAGRGSVREAHKLTRREREILRLVGEGETSRAIAVRLAISTKTVQAHRSNLMAKLALKSTAEIVRYAVRHKVIRVD